VDSVTPDDESDPASYIELIAVVLFSNFLPAPDPCIVLCEYNFLGWWLESETFCGWFCIVFGYFDFLRDMDVSDLVGFRDLPTAPNKQTIVKH
jgi:hypothetical protein